jgi:hypothetical protein
MNRDYMIQLYFYNDPTPLTVSVRNTSMLEASKAASDYVVIQSIPVSRIEINEI